LEETHPGGTGQPFQRPDIATFDLHGKQHAGRRRFAVHEHGAAAARSLFATEMNAAQLELIPKYVGENPPGLDFELTTHLIDAKHQTNLLDHEPSSCAARALATAPPTARATTVGATRRR